MLIQFFNVPCGIRVFHMLLVMGLKLIDFKVPVEYMLMLQIHEMILLSNVNFLTIFKGLEKLVSIDKLRY